MGEMIVFPDTTAAVITAVRAKLVAAGNTAPVGLEVPKPRPLSFATIVRIGGVRRNLVVDEATLAIEAWADTEARAHDLAQLVRAAIHSLVGETTDAGTVYRTGEFAGPTSLPDPDSDNPRYVFTVTVAVRGTAQ